MLPGVNGLNLKDSSTGVIIGGMVRLQFVNWLNEQLSERGWSQRELARRARLSHTSIARVVDGSRNPSADFVASVARALGERPESLFRLAGLLPAYHGTEDEQAIQELEEVWRELSPEERRQVYQYAMWRLNEQKRPSAAGESPSA